MYSRLLVTTTLLVLVLAGGAAQSQGPSNASAPTVDQMRKTVSQLRGNRIAVPSDYDRLTMEQQAYVKSILTGPRADISAPLGVMMVSPGLGDLSQKAMAYARFAGREGFSSVTPKLNELAILMVGKHWSANYVWNAHHNYAVQMGLPKDVVEAILAGRRPARMDKDVEAVYNFCNELLTTRKVSDATLQTAKAILGGDRGVIDLVGTMALYQLTSMMVVVDQSPLPSGVAQYFQ